MFRTLLSDDKEHVLVFAGNEDEPEEFSLEEFVDAYGSEAWEALQELQEPKVGDVVPEPDPADVRAYYNSFRRLVAVCGNYEHKKKLRQNSADGVLKAQVVAHNYYGLNPEGKLASTVQNLEMLREVVVLDLDYWSRRVGYRPMSKPEDVTRYGLNGRADTDILLGYLTDADFRARLYYRIDKYAKKGELRSAKELVHEVFASYKKRPRNKSS